MLVNLLSAVLVTVIQDPQAQPQAARDDAFRYGLQPPPGAVAVVGGLPVPVDLFIDEMASRGTRPDNPNGRDTLNSLIDETLVANEANRRSVVVSDAELDRRITNLDCQLRQHKTCLEAEMRNKGITMDVFRSKLRRQMLLETLTREDQRIPAGQDVSGDQQKVWLKNKRDAAKIEMDRSKLRRGECAVVDGTPLEDRTFVRTLLSSADRKDVRKVNDFLMQYVFAMSLVEQAAGPLTDEDVEREFQERKYEFESNPEYKGIEYEMIVKERTGLDPSALKQSRGFRMNAAISKLSKKLFSPTDVKGYYDGNLAWFGPRYTVRHLLIKGSDRPLRDQSGKALTQPLAQARKQIDGIRRELDQGKRFEDLVQFYSEHLPTRLKGGLLDAFTPKTAPPAFPELGEAVTRLEIGVVSEPILTSAGYHLVKLERTDPAPPVDQVEARIRQHLGTRYFTEAYEKAPKGWDIRID
jgi:parvulin-like peptidyl-prolyl isomerase